MPPILFRRMTRPDLPLLAEWLARPHVAEWWSPTPTLAELEEEFGPKLEAESTTVPYLAFIDQLPIGYLQAYVAMASGDGWWEDQTDPGVRGIDQFLADPQQLGQGIGTAMVSAFVEFLFRNLAVTAIQTDPTPDNARAIRCYQKAGFHIVGEVVTPDGPAVLMRVERSR